MVGEHDAGAPSASGGGEAVEAPQAWRLTFEYHDDDVRLVARQQLAMVSPPDDTELLERGKAGYWVEVRDGAGRPLYRQVLHDPIQTDYEVFSPEPGQSPTRVAAPEVKGVFQAVVPDLPGASEVVLHGRVSRLELADRAAKQLLKARLRGPSPRKEGDR